MWNWFLPQCPANLRDKVWVERRTQWLASQFGSAPLLEQEMVLPTSDFLPTSFGGSQAEVQSLLEIVSGYMGTDSNRFDLRFFDGDKPPSPREQLRPSNAAGLYFRAEGNQRATIEVATKILNDPPAVVATLAHEIAHDRLLGEGRLTGNEPDHEDLTDLTTVFFGLGIYPANTVFRTASWSTGTMSYWQSSRQGYLKDNVFGYAMALRAWLRRERSVPWAAYLTTNPQAACLDGLRFLNRTNDCACHRDSVLNGVVLPTEISETELRSGSDTLRVSALMALWDHPAPTAEHLSAVVDSLGYPNQYVQFEAISWLRTQSELPLKAIHYLISLTRNGQDEIPLLAAELLGRQRPGGEVKTPDGLSQLDELLSLTMRVGEDKLTRLVELLAAYGPKAVTTLPRFVKVLRSYLVEESFHDVEWLVPLLLQIAPNLDDRLKDNLNDNHFNTYKLMMKELKRNSGKR